MSVKTFFPGDIGSFNPNGPGYILLKKGYEVSVDSNGWVVDARDPRTSKIYASNGDEVGTRSKSFESSDEREFKKDIRKTYTPDQKDLFLEGTDIWEALNAGRNVTLDERNTIVEIRDPATGKLYDNLGNETGKTVTSGYPEKTKKEVKNPLIYTNKADDIGMYDPEHWHVAFLQEGYHVTIDGLGETVDIWDPVTGDLYDFNMNVIGSRTDPYPSDNNISNVMVEVAAIDAQIAALRLARSALRGAARFALTALISKLSAKRGHALWRYGRLIGRRRRMDIAYQKRRMKEE